MLVWLPVLPLAAVLQLVQAYPKPARPQLGSLGKHGGVATEVRDGIQSRFFLDIVRRFVSIGGGMLRDRS